MEKEDSSAVLERDSTFLPRPVTEKVTLTEEDDLVVVAQSSMQGWRRTMEDVAVVWTKIPGDTTDTKYFGIFDGHGGTSVAEYAGTFLIHNIMNQPEWKTNLKEAIRKGFVECDQQLREERDPNQLVSGSTALTVFIRGDHIYCGNIGDSRAVGSENDQCVKLSHDHKPSISSERERILSAGGHVFQDRVNGNLGLSRAFGDFAYKKYRSPPEQQMVTPVPEVIMKPLGKQWQFIVMACDGIWEVLNDDSVTNFVRSKLFQRKSPGHVAEMLMQQCLAPAADMYAVGCDNMTMIIVLFKWAQFAPMKPKSSYYKG
ncbi:hypothetical protein GE061_002383 [Apolygus lucorum]|uniref:protein-serine/threonine phosphatase n=1 Tax=Apolygus lucorum TaxID=248454 RepID=A0A6A4IZ77_APOLU|nr:hypothetical protein GE061_002383 [Apolygus lucorum]